jgi:hypothetical protein
MKRLRTEFYRRQFNVTDKHKNTEILTIFGSFKSKILKSLPIILETILVLKRNENGNMEDESLRSV